MRQFKLSRDPEFVPKLRDIVGLYVDPPAHAIVLSVDEKSQIQALDRTQPGLPLKPGRCGTMTHDYKRNGTTTLFAALDVLDGKVIGRCMQRHRHQEFIRFLNAIEAEIPAGKIIHVILDNYGSHKHPKVRAWLDRHPRFTFHYTPTSASWLNAVEGFFAKLTRRRLKRGVFRSLVDLQAAIKRFLAETNDNPKPFVWTADPDKIIAAVRRGYQVLDSIHTSPRGLLGEQHHFQQFVVGQRFPPRPRPSRWRSRSRWPDVMRRVGSPLLRAALACAGGRSPSSGTTAAPAVAQPGERHPRHARRLVAIEGADKGVDPARDRRFGRQFLPFKDQRLLQPDRERARCKDRAAPSAPPRRRDRQPGKHCRRGPRPTPPRRQSSRLIATAGGHGLGRSISATVLLRQTEGMPIATSGIAKAEVSLLATRKSQAAAISRPAPSA